ncbi:MAG: 4Fe-4S binding protein [Bacteroidales bacterium]|nr:4Fe-4S binding protein [Bacteroidales bacterium]MDD4208845.1 4Fe-4S binding protein [Bacteroidales bacterium]
MKRNIIKIDEEKCNGCGLCVSGCHEGALQLIDGKARMVSDLFCDGLGACIGECPEGAISIEEREAEAYDEIKVMERMAAKGEKTILAHLKHLKDFNEMGYFQQGLDYLKVNNIDIDLSSLYQSKSSGCAEKGEGGCPGSREQSFAKAEAAPVQEAQSQASQLTHWPIQLHLINPNASFLKNSDLLLAADCTAFTLGSFHPQLLKGKTLAIACPKLDTNKEVYVDKLRVMIDEARINTITLAIMEVPCCGGLLQLVNIARETATRTVPVRRIVVGIQGDILSDDWV